MLNECSCHTYTKVSLMVQNIIFQYTQKRIDSILNLFMFRLFIKKFQVCHYSAVPKKYKPVTHIIFDMDGTILDSEVLYTQTYKEIFAKYGKELTIEAKLNAMGKQSEVLSVDFVETFKLPIKPEEFREMEAERIRELGKDVKVLPGVEKLMCHFKAHCIPMALATSSAKHSFDIKTRPHKALFDMFHHSILGSIEPEVKNSKPAPDIFLVAASRFPDKPKPEKCLVFEDSLAGVQGARAAGMQVVMTPPKELPCELTKYATLSLDSLEDFKPEEFGLPPFDKN